MAIYLKKFETQAAYEAAQSSLILPNVSLTVDNNTVHYNPSSPTPSLPITYNFSLPINGEELENKQIILDSNYSWEDVCGDWNGNKGKLRFRGIFSVSPFNPFFVYDGGNVSLIDNDEDYDVFGNLTLNGQTGTFERMSDQFVLNEFYWDE